MPHETVFIVLALILGFYMAWNIGANDVANAMGTSVGSGALTIRQALIIAAVLEFCGAFFVGSHVSETIENGIINTSIFTGRPEIFIIGMLSSLLAAGVWLNIASYAGWPVSTTHSIVGAVVGFGLIIGGPTAIYWGNIISIVLSWIISPLIGGILSYVTFQFLKKKILFAEDPLLAAKKITPSLVFCVFLILTLVTLFKGIATLQALSMPESMLLALSISSLAALISHCLLKRVNKIQEPSSDLSEYQVHIDLSRSLKYLEKAQKQAVGLMQDELDLAAKQVKEIFLSTKKPLPSFQNSDYAAVEKIFVSLQIVTACCMAFAHGANDVANAIGPLSAVITVARTGLEGLKGQVPAWILALGGAGIVLGLATWGWRVIETIGKKITELTPSRGFAAEFGAATTILLASKLGLPVSTTHTLVGSVLGVGLARGFGTLNLTVVRDIFVSWVITVPVGAILAIIFYSLFSLIL
ncbi:MAG: inorganic phosphate transporter [Chlamydiae bacterium]|nr:inorganic phosphate transporter [Chlamydiota bacterium]